METPQPKVSVGVLIKKDGKVLLGKRKGSYAAGEWGVPGGHLEYGESFEDAVRREVLEETGLEIQNIKFCFVTNVTRYTPKHYVFVCFTADWKFGEPVNKEPEKCDGWSWHPLDHMPEGIRTVPDLYVEAFKSGRNYFPDL